MKKDGFEVLIRKTATTRKLVVFQLMEGLTNG